jgi:hypothetical protein
MEIWKNIQGYDRIYQISTYGEIRSLDRTVMSGKNRQTFVQGKKLKPVRMKSGHLQITLCKNGVEKTKLLHHLVLETFVGPCPEGMECRHFPDRDPSNNRLDNLLWGTRQENRNDMKFHGTNLGCKGNTKGERQHLSKLTSEQIIDIRKKYASGKFTQKQLGELFGVDKTNIGQIVKRKTWAHVA